MSFEGLFVPFKFSTSVKMAKNKKKIKIIRSSLSCARYSGCTLERGKNEKKKTKTKNPLLLFYVVFVYFFFIMLEMDASFLVDLIYTFYKIYTL